jgi:hypothetical protein
MTENHPYDFIQRRRWTGRPTPTPQASGGSLRG